MTAHAVELTRRLHDGLLQTLDFMSTGGYGQVRTSHEYQALAGEAAEELRSIIERPHQHVASDLETALHVMVRATRLGPWSASVQVHVDESCAQLAAGSVKPIVLAAREAVSNARQHARCSQITVRCERRNGAVAIDVSDDGVGLPSRVRAGFGIRQSIVERVAEAGGSVEIVRLRGRGTVVRLAIRPALGPEVQA